MAAGDKDNDKSHQEYSFKNWGYTIESENALLANLNDDFEKWRQCQKCHSPLEDPKALPCLHTLCMRCLKIHYQVIKLQVAAHEKAKPKKYNFFSWGCIFPCPVCNYPCYLLIDSLLTIPTNNRLLQLTYKERLHWAFGQEQKNSLVNKDLQKINNKGQQASKTSCKFDEDFQLHRCHVLRHLNGSLEQLEKEEDCSLQTINMIEQLQIYNLQFGDDNLEVRHPNAIAVNNCTGHLVVVDTTWNKAVLYKTTSKPYSYKKFDHPIVDVSFYPMTSNDQPEQFCAMGRRADVKGIMVYTATFNADPKDFHCVYQKNLRDVSGILVLEPNILFISLPFANSVIRSINDSQFIDLATRSHHGLFYPTHIVCTAVGEIVVADTGNHRIAVFYGPEFMGFDFYGEFGSEYGQFFYPLGIAADSHRHLYICDSNNYRVQVFDSSFKFESCPINRTFLMSKSVSQDVKPVDCAVNNNQNLVILFRGRGFISIKVFSYFDPLYSYTNEDTVNMSIRRQHSCWKCLFCCKCEGKRTERQSEYEVLN